MRLQLNTIQDPDTVSGHVFVSPINELGSLTSFTSCNFPGGTNLAGLCSRQADPLTSGTYSIASDQGGQLATMNVVLDVTSTNNFTIQSASVVVAGDPEINVTFNTTDIPAGDTTPSIGKGTDFGYIDPYLGTSRNYTIHNVGSDTLTLGADAVSVTGSGEFSVVAQPATSIAASGSTTFQISFNPTDLGAETATVSIANDDADESPYTFSVEADTIETEITVSGNSTTIPSDDTSPSSTDDTEFGSVNLGSNAANTFTIAAVNATLVLGTNAVSLTGNSDFVVTTQPDDVVTIGGFSLELTQTVITFTPSSAGVKTATVSINNNDPDENPYTFVIQGTGSAISSPEINLVGNSNSITSGDAALVANDTDFGSLDISTGSDTHTFTIQNTGSASLGITSITSDSAEFVVASAPSSVAAGAAETFTITFDPSATGARSATITLLNDDADESTYTLPMAGTVTATAEINLVGNSNSITSGDAALVANDTDFGSLDISTGSDTHTFTIQNAGSASLGITSITSDSAEFVVASAPSSVAASATETFTVTFDPSATGARSATITILNDDANESSYTLPMAGTGTGAAEINLVGNSNSITSGDAALVANDTDFGSFDISTGTDTHTFSIQNTGSATLNITSIISDNSEFAVASVPSSVAASATETFTVTFDPSATGARSATITILNDDGDESSYTLPMAGTGIDVTAPLIASIERNTPTTETTDADSLIWRVTFNENVTGVDTADFSVAGTTATITNVTAVSASIYDVTVSGGDLASLEATVTLTILVVGGDNIEDTAGNDFANAAPIGTNDNTFIITADATAPTVAILNAPASHDRSSSFSVILEFSEDVTGFDIGDVSVGGGAASNFVTVDANTYTADITPSGVADVTIDIAAAAAEDLASNDNVAATTVTVKSSIVEETQSIIADFMINRANHILNNQPDMIGFVTGSNNDGGGPLGNLQYESDFSTKTILSFSTSHSKVLAAGKGDRVNLQDGSESQTFAQTDFNGLGRYGLLTGEQTDQAAVELEPLRVNASDNNALSDQVATDENRTGSWDVWTEIHGAQSTQTDVKSKFWNASVGSHFFVNNDTLLGLVAQFDWADEINNTAGSNVSGTGYMVGPYVAGKIKDQNLYYEARALWGQSANQITPIGTYTDTFKTERWLASTKLQGVYKFEDFVINPTLSLSYFEEMQKSYTDTNANVIPEQTISLGEFKFGPEIARSFDIGRGYTIGTNVGISGIVNFGVKNGASSTSNTFGNNQVRARIDAGLDLVNIYGTKFSIAGYYDGLGASGFHSFGGKFGLVVPIQ